MHCPHPSRRARRPRRWVCRVPVYTAGPRVQWEAAESVGPWVMPTRPGAERPRRSDSYVFIRRSWTPPTKLCPGPPRSRVPPPSPGNMLEACLGSSLPTAHLDVQPLNGIHCPAATAASSPLAARRPRPHGT